MRKNVASQYVAFQAVSITDGSAVTTGTPAVYYTIDGGTQGTGSGACVHEGNGQWSYACAQAETNGNHVVFTFVLSGAVSQSVNVYPVGYDETAANLPSDVIAISGDTTAANNAESFFDGTGYAGTNNVIPTVTDVTNLHASAATAAELAKVPKSDSNVSWNATALAAINAEVDSALNTAIPGSPTANSINERVATMDGLILGTIAAGTHNPQSGDAYGVVNNGTYGNSAIRTILTSTGVPLTSTERTTLAAALEAAIINELDGTAVMQAIADLIASDMTTTDLTVAAIASAVRDAILNRVLAGNHDSAGTVGKVLQDVVEDTGTTIPATLTTITGYVDCLPVSWVTVPTAAQNSTQVASDLAAAHGAGSWATATSVTVSDKTGFKLASDGLDSVATTAPTGPASNFREMLVQTWRRFFKRSTRTYSGGTQQIKTYADDGTTPITTQTISDDGTTETQGVAS